MPYGWREIDIAAVAPRLISEQKVTIKYAGNTIQPKNPKLPDMLRKKSEIGRTSISKRQVVSITKMKEVKEFLREYFDVMDVPDDEDGLIAFIDDAVACNPLHVNIPSDVIDSIAGEVIKYERNCVSGISTALGMPGGVAMVASIPADIAQYYGYLLRATQKLMYLHGFPEIDTTEKGQTFDSETLNILIICMGVMYGAAGASNALKVMAKALASGVEKQLPRRALTKGTIYPIVKSVAKWFSVKMTKEVFAGFSGGWPLPCPNCAGVYTGRGFSSGLRTARRIREEARHTPRTATPSGPNTFLSRACHDRYSGKSYTGAECAQPVFAGKRRSQSNYRYTNRRILSNHRTPRSVHPGRRMLAACKIGPGIRTECWGQSLAAAPQGHTARYRRLIG